MPNAVTAADISIPVPQEQVFQAAAEEYFNVRSDVRKVPFDSQRYFDEPKPVPPYVMERWRQIDNFSWTASTAVGATKSYEPISLLFTASDPNPLKDYAKYFKCFQSDVEIRVTIPSVPNVSGLVVMTRTNYKSAVSPGTPNVNAFSFDPQHQKMPLGSPASVTRVLGWQDVGPAQVADAATAAPVGAFTITLIAPIVTTSTTVPVVNFLVEARLVNPKLVFPVSVATLAMIKDHMQKSKPATESENKKQSTVPVKTQPKVETNGWDFGTNLIDKFFGLVEEYAPMLVTLFLTAPDITSRTFTSGVRDPQFRARGQVDSTAIGASTDYYVKPPAGYPHVTDFYSYTDWALVSLTKIAPTDTNKIINVRISPGELYQLGPNAHPSSSNNVYNLFNFWKGDMNYEIFFVAPAGVGGRLRVFRQYEGAGFAPTAATYPMLENTIVPFSGDTAFGISMPYRAQHELQTYSNNDNGYLSIVQDAKFTYTGAQECDVYVAIFARPAKNLVYSHPSSFFNTQTIIAPADYFVSGLGLEDKVSKDKLHSALSSLVRPKRKDKRPPTPSDSDDETEIVNHSGCSYFLYNNFVDLFRVGKTYKLAGPWTGGDIPAFPPFIATYFWFYRGSRRIGLNSTSSIAMSGVPTWTNTSGALSFPFDHADPYVKTGVAIGTTGITAAVFANGTVFVDAPGDDACWMVPVTSDAYLV